MSDFDDDDEFFSVPVHLKNNKTQTKTKKETVTNTIDVPKTKKEASTNGIGVPKTKKEATKPTAMTNGFGVPQSKPKSTAGNTFGIPSSSSFGIPSSSSFGIPNLSSLSTVKKKKAPQKTAEVWEDDIDQVSLRLWFSHLV